MTRLRSHQPAVGPRFLWRTFWRHAREGHDLTRTPLAVAARACLAARARAEEEAEAVDFWAERGYAFRHRTAIASRALKRRGWDAQRMVRAALEQGIAIYVLAARVLRAERAA